MENRDFKGVWIPKEIWLNTELTMLEKVIFVEIDSLDGPEHCYASNEYFADFCNCSESKVSKAIKKLKDLKLIEEVSFDGRHRKLSVVKSDNQSSKKCYAEQQKMTANNIDSNTNNNNKNSSKEELHTQDFQFGYKKPRAKKENLYSKCTAMIDDFSDNPTVRKDLHDYLALLLEMKKEGKQFYTNTWKGLLRKLGEISSDPNVQHESILYSIQKGYIGFYNPADRQGFKSGSCDIRKGKPWEKGVTSETYTEEEKREIDRQTAEREARGEQVWY